MSDDQDESAPFTALELAVNGTHDMCDIIVRLFGEAAGELNSNVRAIARHDWNQLSFALHHLQELMVALMRQYHGEETAPA